LEKLLSTLAVTGQVLVSRSSFEISASEMDQGIVSFLGSDESFASLAALESVIAFCVFLGKFWEHFTFEKYKL